MIFGRIEIWFREKEEALPVNSFFGQEVVRRLANPQEKCGNFHIAKSMKATRQYAEKYHPLPLTVTDFGFTTYWIWRFFLTLYTPSFKW